MTKCNVGDKVRIVNDGGGQYNGHRDMSPYRIWPNVGDIGVVTGVEDDWPIVRFDNNESPTNCVGDDGWVIDAKSLELVRSVSTFKVGDKVRIIQTGGFWNGRYGRPNVGDVGVVTGFYGVRTPTVRFDGIGEPTNGMNDGWNVSIEDIELVEPVASPKFSIGDKVRCVRLNCGVPSLIGFEGTIVRNSTARTNAFVVARDGNANDERWFDLDEIELVAAPVEEPRKFVVGDRVRMNSVGRIAHGDVGTFIEDDGSAYIPLLVRFDTTGDWYCNADELVLIAPAPAVVDPLPRMIDEAREAVKAMKTLNFAEISHTARTEDVLVDADEHEIRIYRLERKEAI